MASHQEANPIPIEASQTPASMEQFVQMLHNELRHTQQQNAELSRTLMEMRQEMASTTTPTSAPTSSEPVTDISNQKRPKPRLPKPEPFTGENLSLYSQFELKLMAKLNIDGESIGTEYQKLWYAFNLLEGKAAARIHPWMKVASDPSYVGSFTVKDLIEQTRKAFLDPALQDKALLRLNTLKQGNRTLREFLSEFDRLLLEAGGLGWTDNVKKGYLRAAVSYSILQGMVGTLPDSSYERYCDQLRMVDDQLEQLRRIAKGKGKTNVQAENSEPKPGDAMDWEPTVAATTQGTRPSNTRTEQRKCYRCGKVGHLKRNCQETVSAAPATVTAVMEEVEEEENETPSA